MPALKKTSSLGMLQKKRKEVKSFGRLLAEGGLLRSQVCGTRLKETLFLETVMLFWMIQHRGSLQFGGLYWKAKGSWGCPGLNQSETCQQTHVGPGSYNLNQLPVTRGLNTSESRDEQIKE